MSQPSPSPEPSAVVNSTRSSFTYVEPHPIASEKDLQRLASTHSARIEEVTSRGEDEFERYGGDDIHEPPPKPSVIRRASLPSVPTIDADMVTWDGPHDPTNPQNWTIKYKWLVTIVVIIMTVNVWVKQNFTFLLDPHCDFIEPLLHLHHRPPRCGL
jgi:hypothetical protein